MRQTVEFVIVAFSKGELHLRKPLPFDCQSDAGGVIARNEKFGISSYGRSLNEAIDNAKEEFGDLWLSIGAAPIGEIHESAQALRWSLRETVVGMTPKSGIADHPFGDDQGQV